MLLPIKAICLRTVKYNDNTSIVTLWTWEKGRLSASVPAGKSQEARRRRALMMPLGLIEATANIRSGKEIATLSDVRPYRGGKPAGTHPMKGLISLFLADFLCAVLRENQSDPHLSMFLFDSVAVLGNVKGTAMANFPLYFLYGLGRFLGIQPDDGTYSPGAVFDMREGVFTATPPMHTQWLDQKASRMVHTLARLTPERLHCLRLNRAERNSILDAILRYYSMHHTQVTSLSSLQILRQVLDD